ncbi:MAG: restriction endonuclease subunit S, partial [Enterococcus faecalis]|nr:restriction endonuclease subunit S [Enterococcus faecalis]
MIVFTLIGVWELCKLGRVVERVTRKNKELKSTLPLTISAQEG